MIASGGFSGLLLVLIWIGWKLKWWKNLMDCPLMSSGRQDPEQRGELPPDAWDEDPGDEAEDGQGKTRPLKTSRTGAREEVKQERERCRSTLMYVTNLLSEEVNVRTFLGIVRLSRPINAWCNDFMRVAFGNTDERSMARLQIEFASGRLVQLVDEIGRQYFSEDLCEVLGALALDG
eukprot:369406-Amphidinium_carterae.1